MGSIQALLHNSAPTFKRTRLQSPPRFLEPDDVEELSEEYIPPHPLDVRPGGNALVLQDAPDLRRNLGLFSCLSDELLSYFLEFLDAKEVVKLGGTCKAFYAFTRVEETWRRFFEENPPSEFTWRGSWRSTLLNLPETEISKISCRGFFSDIIYRPFYCSHVPISRFLDNIPSRNSMPRLSSLTEDEFSTKWVNTPFILTGQITQWPIFKTWSTDFLLQNFPDVKFRAESLEWTLQKYVSYMRNNSDESPLYLFDKSFASSLNLSSSGTGNRDFWTPSCFGEDLFTHLGTDRPDSTWMILGSARSGSTLHVDPNGTSAWNAVIQGSKYWLMFPPPDSQGSGYPPGVIISDDASEITAPVSIPEYMLSFHEIARKFPGVKEGICKAGEMMYVPAGWFHLVWNLDEGLAVTGNFVHRSKLPDVLRFMRNKEDQVSGFDDKIEHPYELFVSRLRENRPEVLEEALEELRKREERSSNKGTKRKWEDVKKEDDEGAFTFGFGDDDDDDEEDEYDNNAA